MWRESWMGSDTFGLEDALPSRFAADPPRGRVWLWRSKFETLFERFESQQMEIRSDNRIAERYLWQTPSPAASRLTLPEGGCGFGVQKFETFFERFESYSVFASSIALAHVSRMILSFLSTERTAIPI